MTFPEQLLAHWKYSEDQPRDEDGKFGSGGGESSHAPSKDDVKWAKKVDEERPLTWARSEEEKTAIKADEKILDAGANEPEKLLSKDDQKQYETNADYIDATKEDGADAVYEMEEGGTAKLTELQRQDKAFQDKLDAEQAAFRAANRPAVMKEMHAIGDQQRGFKAQIKQTVRDAEDRQNTRFSAAEKAAHHILMHKSNS